MEEKDHCLSISLPFTLSLITVSERVCGIERVRQSLSHQWNHRWLPDVNRIRIRIVVHD